VGPQGIPGQDSATVGLSDYAEYYTRLDTLPFLISANDSVPFKSVGVVAPITSAIGRVDSSKFVLKSGYYRISWRVPTSSPGTLRLNVNGVGLARTITGSNQSCEITNTVLLLVDVDGTIIFLENPGAEFAVPASSDEVVSLTLNIVIVLICPFVIT
jgi:hypothetical protein